MRKSAELLANQEPVKYNRASAAEEWKRLLSTPGAKTSDRMTIGVMGRRAGKSSLSASIDALSDPDSPYNKSLVKDIGLVDMPKATSEKVTTILLDEVEAELQIEEEFGEVLVELNKKFKASKETFMLTAPMVLTVKRPKGYSKSNHIGSEDFKPLRAYMGKKGKIIIVFRPVMTADYEEMEMEEAQAKQHLMGFEEFFKEAMWGVREQLSDFHKRAALEQEKAALTDRFETYKDLGFGSW
jgi:hypothetical protein